MSTSSSCLLYFTQAPRAKTDRAVERLGDKKDDTKRREMAIKRKTREKERDRCLRSDKRPAGFILLS